MPSPNICPDSEPRYAGMILQLLGGSTGGCGPRAERYTVDTVRQANMYRMFFRKSAVFLTRFSASRFPIFIPHIILSFYFPKLCNMSCLHPIFQNFTIYMYDKPVTSLDICGGDGRAMRGLWCYCATQLTDNDCLAWESCCMQYFGLYHINSK